jgi:hypothetical protein
MPPKRSVPAELQSPPQMPDSGSNMDHHHSPIDAHHPDLPVDSAAASASPQSKRFKENEMPPIPSSPNESPETSEQIPEATDLLLRQPAAVAGGGKVLASSPTPNTGAREAYHAVQQQRIATCNLSLIPPSK